MRATLLALKDNDWEGRWPSSAYILPVTTDTNGYADQPQVMSQAWASGRRVAVAAVEDGENWAGGESLILETEGLEKVMGEGLLRLCVSGWF